MNRRKMIYVMSVIMIVIVYIASHICPSIFISARGNGSSDERYDGYYDDYVELVQYAGRVVVIDSGHGGIDPGMISGDGVYEKDINLSIAMKLKTLLEEAQITVVMTRTTDAGLYESGVTNKKTSDLKARCDIINNCDADIAISIHQNSYASADVSGAQVFYYKNSVEGKRLACSVQEALTDAVDTDNTRAAKANGDYYLMLNTNVPLIIAECGFLSNAYEAKLLATEEYQDKIAAALYEGIVRYIETLS